MFPLKQLLCIVPEGAAALPTVQQAVYLAEKMDATLHVGGPDAASTDSLRGALDGALARVDRPVQTRWIGAFDQSSEQGEAIQQYVTAMNVDLVVTSLPLNEGGRFDSAYPLWAESLACSLFVTAQAVSPSAMQRLLVPTNGAAQAQAALDCAAHLASAHNASVDLLYVIETTPYVALTPVDRLSLGRSPVAERRAQRRLGSLLGDELPDVPINTHVQYGTLTDRIPRFIEQNDVDLTVMAAASPMSSKAERVLREGPLPVLLARSS